MQHGPTRGELWFRLWFSLFGLGLMLFAVFYRGMGGIAWVEIVGVTTVFFGGTALWAGWRLLKPD